MKNLKKVELFVIGLTILCLVFTAGYFVGRGAGTHIVSFDTLPVPSLSTPSPADTTPAAAAAETAPSASFTPSAMPVSPAAEASAAEAVPASGKADKLNINTATAAELEALPGIGEVLAQRIIDYRTANGSFQNISQLKDIDGIGDKKFDAMKDMITVD